MRVDLAEDDDHRRRAAAENCRLSFRHVVTTRPSVDTTQAGVDKPIVGEGGSLLEGTWARELITVSILLVLCPFKIVVQNGLYGPNN